MKYFTAKTIFFFDPISNISIYRTTLSDYVVVFLFVEFELLILNAAMPIIGLKDTCCLIKKIP